jgi:ligand-binding sensor domain-containing protein
MLASATVVSGRELQQLDEYTVTTWTTVKDDLPSGIVWSIAQDPHGSLWLGTSSGLVRFDGFRFTRWQNPTAHASASGFVRVVTCARDGSLWVGSGERDGGITHISGQDVHTYGVDEGSAVAGSPPSPKTRKGRFGRSIRPGYTDSPMAVGR